MNFMKLIMLTCSFIVIDVFTGLLKSFKQGTFNSSIMRQGFFHKTAEVSTIFIVYYLTYVLRYIGFEIPSFILVSINVYFIGMEMGSIIENIGCVNPQMKDVFGKFFEKLKEGDTNGTKN